MDDGVAELKPRGQLPVQLSKGSWSLVYQSVIDKGNTCQDLFECGSVSVLLLICTVG